MLTKRIVLVLFTVCLSAMYGKAAELVDGYIVPAGKDTVRCKIEIPRMANKTFDLFLKVSVTDSAGHVVTYKAKNRELNGFGFVYGGANYEYHLWKDNKDDVFAMRKITGKKVNLYYYYTYESMGGGSMPVKNEMYILEDTGKNAISVSGGLLSGFKKKIKKFFEADSKIAMLVDTNISTINDLPAFVNKINKL